MQEMAHKGNEDLLCIYIDIKRAFYNLDSNEQQTLLKSLIQGDKSIDKKLINSSLNKMEDFLNGR